MPLSFRKFLSTGQATYPIGFNYISPDHVQVLVNGVPRTTGYSLANGNITFSSPIPARGVELRVYRNTPGRTDPTRNSVIVDFVNGATLSETDLDAAVKQNFYLVQEAQDTAEGAVLSEKSVTEPMMNDNAVSTRVIQDGSVTTPKLANLSVTNAKLADGSVSEAKMADDSVSERTIVDQSVIEAHVKTGFLSTIVRTSGDQSIAGTKTFTDSPNVPPPVIGNHATNKSYVDLGDSGYPGSNENHLLYPVGTTLICETAFPQDYGPSEGPGAQEIYGNFWASANGGASKGWERLNLFPGGGLGGGGGGTEGVDFVTLTYPSLGPSPLRANVTVDVYFHPQNFRMHWVTGVITPPAQMLRENAGTPSFLVCPTSYVPHYTLLFDLTQTNLHIKLDGRTPIGSSGGSPYAVGSISDWNQSTKLAGTWKSRGCLMVLQGQSNDQPMRAVVMVQRTA